MLVVQPLVSAVRGILTATLMVYTVCTPVCMFDLRLTGVAPSFHTNIGSPKLLSLVFMKKGDSTLKQVAGFHQVWVYEQNAEAGCLHICLCISICPSHLHYIHSCVIPHSPN